MVQLDKYTKQELEELENKTFNTITELECDIDDLAHELTNKRVNLREIRARIIELEIKEGVK